MTMKMTMKMMRYKPMLAYPVSDKPIDYSKPIFIQPKLDGVRCLIQYDRRTQLNYWYLREDTVIAYSRTGKVWKNIQHILTELRPFFKKYPDVVLDGELYNHNLKDDFGKIISLVRKTKPTDKDRLEASELTQFHCYDIIDEKLPFDQRIVFVNQSLILLGNSIHIVDTLQCWSEIGAKNAHKVNLKNGYEGSIVRTNDAYQCKRSHNLRKFKDFSDAEATIIGFAEGKGKRIGTLGKFIMRDDDGNEFGCPPGKGYNYKDMSNLLHRAPHYIGAKATFTYFERTKAGSYRHPLFKSIRDYE